ncbi:MAG: tyrosine--tRNA ligase [Patescibacteria group bacterium]
MSVFEKVLPVKPVLDAAKIDRLLTRGVDTVYPTKEKMREALMSGERLRFYVGFDPTAPFLHIGHALQLRKLRELQELGHEVIWLLGSFTAMIGDPTDKLAARKQLTRKDVLENAKTYKKQASKILRFKGENAVKLMFNDKWLAKMSFEDVIALSSHFTVQQMMERDMFEKRLEEQKPIYLHEFLYPLMQGYDSVAMDVDGELGGSDQTFNMLAGRILLREMKQKEKFVIALSLLTNNEGKKMSKSEGGFIALTDVPEEMFGKIMAMDDSMIVPYFTLATDVSDDEIEVIKKALADGMNPRDVKMRLAEMVTATYHSATKAKAAKKHFVQVFTQREMPDEIPTFSPTSSVMTVVDVMVATNLAPSKGEARRLIEQGGVKLGGEVVTDAMLSVYPRTDEVIMQKGKRFFVKLLP